MSDVFKALADPTRRKILELLREKPMTAGDLADQFLVSKPTMSGHFNVLSQAGLVDKVRSGTTITYSLNLSVLEEALARLFDALRLGQAPSHAPSGTLSPSPKDPIG